MFMQSNNWRLFKSDTNDHHNTNKLNRSKWMLIYKRSWLVTCKRLETSSRIHISFAVSDFHRPWSLSTLSERLGLWPMAEVAPPDLKLWRPYNSSVGKDKRGGVALSGLLFSTQLRFALEAKSFTQNGFRIPMPWCGTSIRASTRALISPWNDFINNSPFNLL